jgi:type VI secretion system protein ImpK
MFRTQIRKALEQAENFGQSHGYIQDDIRLASFAVIALLDETILNSSNPAFRDWAQKPLMLDLYDTLHAGETYFEYLSAMLKRGEDNRTIDLLEVYLLCLLLGFRGRYSSGNEDQLRFWRDPLVEKILRNRGGPDYVELSPAWLPEADVRIPPPSNRFSRLVLSCTIGVVCACLVLVVLYNFLLGAGVDELAAHAPR